MSWKQRRRPKEANQKEGAESHHWQQHLEHIYSRVLLTQLMAEKGANESPHQSKNGATAQTAWRADIARAGTVTITGVWNQAYCRGTGSDMLRHHWVILCMTPVYLIRCISLWRTFNQSQNSSVRQQRSQSGPFRVSTPLQDNSQFCSNVAYTFAKQVISQFPSETRAFLHILL